MKAKLYDKNGNVKGDVNLPKCFSSRIRADILLKVFETQKGIHSQPYGSMEGAGAQYSASGISKKKRHDWKATYGKGISRVPRKVMSRHGSSFNWVGATVSNTRGGRRPHAPRAEKNLFKKVNKKELLIALKSALVGTFNAAALEKKFGRKMEMGGVFTSDILDVKTKDFVLAMKAVFGESMISVLKSKTIRSGIGKMRGRKYKSNAGLLFVVGNEEEMKRSGVTVIKVSDLTVKDLAPNGVAGRLACYSEKAVEEIANKFEGVGRSSQVTGGKK
jgi:large subunit ribosomal protein L4e